MTELDDLPGRLRTQMQAATAADLAPPDLLERVHRGVARRRHRNVGALAAVAVAAGVAVVAVPSPEPWSAPERLAGPGSPADELSVVRSDSGQLAIETSTENGEVRTERVDLPGFLQNAGEGPVTVVGLSVPGTDLQAELPQQPALVPGGRLPLTLTRVVDCAADPDLPAQLDLRVTVLEPGGPTTVLLPLPEEVVALYRTSHACSPERRAADDAEARAAQEARRQAEQATAPPAGE